MIRGTLYRLVVLLLLMVAAVAGGVALLIWRQHMLFLLILIALGIIIFAIARLFLYSTRKVAFMFNSIENEDFSFNFDETRGARNDKTFNRSLNRIRDLILQTRLEIIQNEKYYELILGNVGSGLMVIDDTGSVFQHNQALNQLLGVSVLTHINQLGKLDARLPSMLFNLKAAGQEQIKFYTESREMNLVFRASMLTIGDRNLKIISISDIGSELERREADSWQRLTRVLTHEIMNSIAPISALSETLLEKQTDPETTRGLHVIHTTSQGLMNFVQSYRRYTRIPTPEPALFYVREFLERVAALFPHEIQLTIQPDDLILFADESLVQQVVVNMIKNGFEAAGEVSINAYSDPAEQVVIEISDTGHGISSEVADNIFVPFFTTKDGGSGIGLSISRQIMRLHNGSLTVGTPRGNQSTLFILTFA